MTSRASQDRKIALTSSVYKTKRLTADEKEDICLKRNASILQEYSDVA